MEPLEGKVAWVAGGGEGVGRAVALLLASRGCCVLVTGPEERALGACVGEMAHAGGKARHKVGDVRTAEGARACAEGAIERFGALDVTVVAAASLEEAVRAVDAARDSMRPRGRLVVLLLEAREEEPRLRSYMGELAALVAPRSLTCNAVFLGAPRSQPPAIRAAEPEDVAEVVAFLCGHAGDVVSGSVITLG